jgi:hypothetical protein
MNADENCLGLSSGGAGGGRADFAVRTAPIAGPWFDLRLSVFICGKLWAADERG